MKTGSVWYSTSQKMSMKVNQFKVLLLYPKLFSVISISKFFTSIKELSWVIFKSGKKSTNVKQIYN